MAFVRKRSAIRWPAFALGVGISLVMASAALAQALPSCTYELNREYLRTVVNPPPSDRQEIMDLLHRYNWALDDASTQGVEAMLLDDVAFELCTGRKQLQRKTNKTELLDYLDTVNAEMGTISKRRHIESNTLLNAVDQDTVQGKSTVVVTIQFTAIETPVLDYTATMVTTFKRVGGAWKFAMIVLLPDSPRVTLSAR